MALNYDFRNSHAKRFLMVTLWCYFILRTDCSYAGKSLNVPQKWSKIAVIDVIDFRCESLGSSTVQLGSLDNRLACTYSEVGFSSQDGGRAWGCITEEQRSIVRFVVRKKDAMQRIFTIKCLPFCLGGFAVYSSSKLVANVSLMTQGLKRKWRSGWDNILKTSKLGFDALVKRWDKCISVGGGYVKKYTYLLFSGSTIIYFKFYIHFWPTLPRMKSNRKNAKTSSRTHFAGLTRIQEPPAWEMALDLGWFLALWCMYPMQEAAVAK
jgi:hypothetical protein